MRKTFVIILFSLLALLPLVFADLAAPMPPQINFNLTKNGQPYLGDANVTYICSVAKNQTNMNDSDLADISLRCLPGSCTNQLAYDYMGRSWYYPGSPCFYSKGKFRVEADGKTLTTQELSLERAGLYEFKFDIATGVLNASEKNPPPGREEYPNPCYCSTLFILLGLVFLANKK